MLKKQKLNSKGFTLIELLIVIVIIGILAGVVIAVINPAKQQRRAKEAVLRGNFDKGCLAMYACANTATSGADCDTLAKLGLSDTLGTNTPPTGSQYSVTWTAATNTLAFDATIPAGDPAALGGAGVACTYRCTYVTTTGVSTIVGVLAPTQCYVN